MSRSALVGNLTAMLHDAGFVVSDRCSIRPKSFDIAARRDEELILVKILANIDGFDGSTGREMRRLGDYLNGTPLVIGLRTRDEELRPGVVYFRHGVPVLSPDTALELFIDDVPPLIYAAPGGLYVDIESETLVDERKDRGWSLGQLAKELGVSRRTVSRYEDGMSASIEIAMQLEELFDRPLASPVDVLEGAENVHESEPVPKDPEVDPDDEPMVTIMTAAGFEVHPTNRSPFKAVSEDDGGSPHVLTGHSAYTKAAKKRAELMASISRVTRTKSVYFVDRATSETVEGTAIVEREEVENLKEGEDLRAMIEERSKLLEKEA